MKTTVTRRGWCETPQGPASSIIVEREQGEGAHTIFTKQDPGGLKGWTATEVTVRRVQRPAWSREDYASGEKVFDEVQVGIVVKNFHAKSGRLAQAFGGMTLRGAEITELLGALAAPADPVREAGAAYFAALDAFNEFEREEPNNSGKRWEAVFDAKNDALDRMRAALGV